VLFRSRVFFFFLKNTGTLKLERRDTHNNGNGSAILINTAPTSPS